MSFVAYSGDEGTTSEAIAKSLKTNPVVVRKILRLLDREGLVALRQGRNGGVGLRLPASGITLGQIYKAVESESGVFAMRGQMHKTDDTMFPGTIREARGMSLRDKHSNQESGIRQVYSRRKLREIASIAQDQGTGPLPSDSAGLQTPGEVSVRRFSVGNSF